VWGFSETEITEWSIQDKKLIGAQKHSVLEHQLTTSVFVWLVTDGWCWFVLREKYCWLVADGWFGLREKYCWLVADKPNDQGAPFVSKKSK
jgi:hypothetical protein